MPQDAARRRAILTPPLIKKTIAALPRACKTQNTINIDNTNIIFYKYNHNKYIYVYEIYNNIIYIYIYIYE